MSDFVFTEHAKDVMTERSIPEEWVLRTMDTPDNRQTGADGNEHYTRSIPESDGRILRVVVNENVKPKRVVTVFFDRRLRRKK